MSLQTLTELMPHQMDAVAKIGAIRIGGLLMDMGTGKTRTALEIAVKKVNAGKANRVVWLTPVSTKGNLATDIRKHIADPAIHVFDDKTKAGSIPNATFYIVGIESVSSSVRVIEALESIAEGSVMIVDESHYIKTFTAKRSERLVRIGESAAYRYILTGTPMSKGIEDIYTQMHFLSPKILGFNNFRQFARRHIEYDEDNHRRIKRRYRVGELTAKMAPYVYQVRKEECLSLPEKTYQSRSFSMTRAQERLYEIAKDEILCGEDALTAGDATIYRLFTALQQIQSGFWNDVRGGFFYHLFSERRNPRIALLLDVLDDIPDDRKVIIWCKYKFEIEAIKNELPKDDIAEFHGSMTEAECEKSIARFRGKARYFLAMQGKGGVGLTLNEAHYVVFYSNTFKYAQRAQAEDRCHRIGQTMPVTYIDLACETGIDQMILKCLGRREDAVNEFKNQIDRIRKMKNKKEAEKELKKLLGGL